MAVPPSRLAVDNPIAGLQSFVPTSIVLASLSTLEVSKVLVTSVMA